MTMEETSFSSNVPKTDTYNYGEGHSSGSPLIPSCRPRCLAVGVGLAICILLAAIVAALIVVFRDNDRGKNGSTIDDPISYQECPNITVNLTDSFNISCMFAVGHDTRDDFDKSAYVMITKPDGTTEKEEDGLEFRNGNWTSKIQVIASCATIGSYSVKLEKIPEHFPFTVKLAAPTMVTSLEQVFFNDTNGTSEFRLGCNVSGDCTRYKLDIIGVRGLIMEEINDNRTCVTHFSNTGGTTIACDTTLSDDTVRSYAGLRCKISSDGRQTRYENFRLPMCGKNISTCRDVDCTEESDDRTNIDTCKLGPEFTNECFHPGRKIYSYCKNNETLCECRMNWCQLGSRRITNEQPLQLLCGATFEQPSFTQRPTTTAKSIAN